LKAPSFFPVVVMGRFADRLAASAQVVAAAPYTISVFATSIPGVDFAPDSIAVVDGKVFVGYGDGAAPDGSDGKSSTIVEYQLNGDVVTTYTVPGHNDGLRVNHTPSVWALQNEDASPNLVIIDPKPRLIPPHTPFSSTPHGGGYDDISFRVTMFSLAPPIRPTLPTTGPPS